MQRRDLIFRVFVSSTFSDLVEERNALQETVFPQLRQYCQQRGARFQAIDLRWGVSQEAALDQQTMNICRQELERCQELSPKPNFIVLLGNRYGWRPLPPQIDADEFERLLTFVPEESRSLLVFDESKPEEQQDRTGWYRRDDNAVPPQYVLRPRRVKSNASEEERKAEADEWSGIEIRLRSILVAAVDRLWPQRDASKKDYDVRRRKYDGSATHQEIRHGASEADQPEDHVFCYFREIKGLPDDESAEKFRDLKDGKPDDGAALRLKDLKKELSDRLPEEHIHTYTATWDDGRPSHDLAQFCKDVKTDLQRVIDDELDRFKQRPALEREREAHVDFAKDRSEHFVGRTDVLTRIQEYLESPDDNRPLIIHGKSGSGKTALMAKAWLDRKGTTARFIGTTPVSSDLRSLLTDLCTELGVDSPPQDMNELVRTFRGRLSADEHGTDEPTEPPAPVVLFLDALDQLNPTDNARMLYWLPRTLAPGVKLVMSVLETEASEEENLAAEDPYDLVTRIWPDSLAELGLLDEASGNKLLDDWLSDAKRTLQPDQRADITNNFQANGSPLYLKLAFEEARHWKSWEGLPCNSDDVPGLNGDIPGILVDLFWRLERPERHGALLAQRALRSIAAAKNGLTEDELLDILSYDSEVITDFLARSPDSPHVDRLPVVIWSRLYADLQPYMTQRRADGTVVMDFYHRQVAEAVAGRYLAAPNRLDAYKQLAAYFNTCELNARKAGELPWQLTQAQDWPGLKKLMTSVPFIATAWRLKRHEVLGYWTTLEQKLRISASTAYSVAYKEAVESEISVYDLGEMLFLMGANDAAREIVELEAERCRKLEDAEGLAKASGLLSSIAAIGGDTNSAIQAHQDRVKAAKRTANESELDSATLDESILADILNPQKDPELILLTAIKQEAVARQTGNSQLLRDCLHDQAVAYSMRDENAKALAKLAEAEELAQMDSLRVYLPVTQCTYGTILKRLGRQKEALQRLHIAKEAAREFSQEIVLANCLGQEAIILFERGDVRKAIFSEKEAERRFRSAGDRRGLAKCLLNQAITCLKTGQRERGKARAAEALELMCEVDYDEAGIQACAHLLAEMRKPSRESQVLVGIASFLLAAVLLSVPILAVPPWIQVVGAAIAATWAVAQRNRAVFSCRCPRCGGDAVGGNGTDVCLQCGFVF